jgi:flagellar biosynthesis anti-sigma factor FlgM
MKVDLTTLNGPNLESIPSSQRSAPQGAPVATTDSETALGEDKATLSADSVRVSSLVAKALDAPQIRQEKIDALHLAVQNGTYQLDPGKIAEAMILHSKEPGSK